MKKHTAIITAGIALASLLVAGSATISAHHAFAAEFDARLGGRWARLRDASVEAEGVVATQATLSRDLEELGAVKVRIPGGTMAYAIPEYSKERTTGRVDDHLRRLMGEFVVEVAHSVNLVVLRTPPGEVTVATTAKALPAPVMTMALTAESWLACSSPWAMPMRVAKPRPLTGGFIRVMTATSPYTLYSAVMLNLCEKRK